MLVTYRITGLPVVNDQDEIVSASKAAPQWLRQTNDRFQMSSDCVPESGLLALNLLYRSSWFKFARFHLIPRYFAMIILLWKGRHFTAAWKTLQVGVVSDYDLLALDSLGKVADDRALFPEADQTWQAFKDVKTMLAKSSGKKYVHKDVLASAFKL